MKEKIFGALMALIVLASTTGLWFSYKGTLFLSTNAKTGTEISVQYTEKNSDKKITVKAKTDSKGKVRFELKEKKIAWLKLLPPKGTVVHTVKFRHWKTKKIALTAQNEYAGKTLKGRIDIDWYNLIVLGGLGYYLGWFLIHSLKYGFPKDDPKLPKIMNVEFLRILFTLGVVCCHFFAKINIYMTGAQGVDFFFILSGFFLSLTFNPERKTLEFAKSKFIRWIPLIIFGGFLCRPNFSSLFYPLFFLQNTGLAYQDIANTPAWYLGVLFWVLIFYLSVYKVMKPEARNLFIGTLVFVFYVVCVRSGGDRGTMIYSYFPRGLLQGVAGVGLGCMLQQICVRKEGVVIKKSTTVFEIVALFYIFGNMFINPPIVKEWIFRPISHFIILYLFIRKEGLISNFFEKSIFAKMARYCLSVYLTHFVVTHRIFPIYFEKYRDFFLNYPVIPIVFVLGTSILLGIFAHHAIELPATRALKKWLG